MLGISQFQYNKTQISLRPTFQFLYNSPLRLFMILFLLGIRIVMISMGTLQTSSLTNTIWMNLLIPLHFLIGFIFSKNKHSRNLPLLLLGIFLCGLGIIIFVHSALEFYPLDGFIYLSIGIICQLLIIQLINTIPKNFPALYINTIIHLGIGIILSILAVITQQIDIIYQTPNHDMILILNGILCGILLYIITILNNTPFFILLQIFLPFIVMGFSLILFNEKTSLREIIGTIITTIGILICILEDKKNKKKEFKNE